MKKREWLYMAVTADERELPIYVAESAEEMARWARVEIRSLRQMVAPSRQRRRKGLKKTPYRLVRVDVTEDEEGRCEEDPDAV